MNLFKIIRIVILMLKLLPILFFPYFFTSEDIGLYGVLFGFIYTFMYLVGFEFWFIYNRKFAQEKLLDKQQNILYKQNNQYLLNYLFVIPIFIIILYDFDISLILLSLIIMTLYHLSQELNRIFVHLEDHLNSSVIQLIQSLWVLLLPLNILDNIEKLFIAISIFALISFIYAIIVLHLKFGLKYNISLSKSINLMDYKNIVLIMLSALFLKVMFFLPRFIFNYNENLEYTGIFTYFQSIAMVIEYFSYFFIQAIFVPKLLKNNSNTLIKKFRQQMLWGNAILLMLSSSGLFVLTYYIIKDNIYYSFLNIGLIILLSVSIQAYSGFYASLNYINDDDSSYKKAILFSTLIGFMIYVVTLYVLSNNLILGVALSFLMYSIIILISRMYYAKNYILKEK